MPGGLSVSLPSWSQGLPATPSLMGIGTKVTLGLSLTVSQVASFSAFPLFTWRGKVTHGGSDRAALPHLTVELLHWAEFPVEPRRHWAQAICDSLSGGTGLSANQRRPEKQESTWPFPLHLNHLRCVILFSSSVPPSQWSPKVQSSRH